VRHGRLAPVAVAAALMIAATTAAPGLIRHPTGLDGRTSRKLLAMSRTPGRPCR
jgi:hypothetical protein